MKQNYRLLGGFRNIGVARLKNRDSVQCVINHQGNSTNHFQLVTLYLEHITMLICNEDIHDLGVLSPGFFIHLNL